MRSTSKHTHTQLSTRCDFYGFVNFSHAFFFHRLDNNIVVLLYNVGRVGRYYIMLVVDVKHAD